MAFQSHVFSTPLSNRTFCNGKIYMHCPNGSHWLHTATEHFRCDYCNWETKFFHFIYFNSLKLKNPHMASSYHTIQHNSSGTIYSYNYHRVVSIRVFRTNLEGFNQDNSSNWLRFFLFYQHVYHFTLAEANSETYL